MFDRKLFIFFNFSYSCMCLLLFLIPFNIFFSVTSFYSEIIGSFRSRPMKIKLNLLQATVQWNLWRLLIDKGRKDLEASKHYEKFQTAFFIILDLNPLIQKAFLCLKRERKQQVALSLLHVEVFLWLLTSLLKHV